MLLGFELANRIVAHLVAGGKGDDGTTDESLKIEKVNFDGRQKDIIAYLSGYVVSTFYRCLRYSKRCNEIYYEEYLSVLVACQLTDDSETDKSHHKLINAKNRGGLWKVKSDVSQYSNIAVNKEIVHKIDANHLVSLIMNDNILLAYFSGICGRCKLNVKKENSLNLLEDMLTLYIRLRSHSYAKDKQQFHKKLSVKQNLEQKSKKLHHHWIRDIKPMPMEFKYYFPNFEL